MTDCVPAQLPIARALAAEARPHLARSLWQLLTSLAAFGALWYLALWSLDHSRLLMLVLTPAAACILVRLFIIQHDCGHGSFFSSRLANDVVGSALGVVTLTPYLYWQRVHAIHHATSGNLDRRGVGDVCTLTIREYLARNRLGRLSYRICRHGVTVFILGAVYQFFLKHRLPLDAPVGWRREWASVCWTNLAICGSALTIGQAVGFDRFLIVHLPIAWIAATIGVWLFYVQHQFPTAYWERDSDWRFDRAAIHGSSYYDLPAFLHWCTGNIGFHHIHHLCPRIPNYMLKKCANDHPEVPATRLTFVASLKCVRLKLWDEDRRTLVGFSSLPKLR